MFRWLPAIAVACALPASWASAEQCVCRAGDDFLWGPVGATDPPGIWRFCEPDGSDVFFIGDGCRATVVDDLVQAPEGRIYVRDGGVLVAEVDDATGALALEVGSAGVYCDTGSTCILHGAYRPVEGVAPGLREAPDTETTAAVGQVIPCPEVDPSGGVVEPRCGAHNQYRVRFAEPSGATLPVPEASAGDVLWFFDPDPADAHVPLDVNYPYWVADVDPAPAVGGPWVEIDLRQTSAHDPADPPATGYATRRVVETTLRASVAPGQRHVCVEDAVAADGERVGHWVWFQDDVEACGDGDPEACRVSSEPYRVSHTRDVSTCAGAGDPDPCCSGPQSGADTLVLLDARGAARAFPDGDGAACGPDDDDCRIWITPGAWLAGDSYFVLAPVVVRSATTGRATPEVEQDSEVTWKGTVDVRGLVLDGTGRLNIGFLDPIRTEDVWAVDLASRAHARVHSMGLSQWTARRWAITGGNETSEPETCIVDEGTVETPAAVLWEDFAVRHCTNVSFAASVETSQFTMRRIRSQFGGAPGPWSFVHADSSVVVEDAECVACASGVALRAQDGGIEASGLAFLGGKELAITDGDQPMRLRDVLVVGVRTSGLALFRRVDALDGFVVRDLLAEPDGSPRILDTFALEPDRTSVMERGLVDRSAAGGFPTVRLDGRSTLRNVAVLDPRPAEPACGSIGLGPYVADVRMEGVTIAWPPGAAGCAGSALFLGTGSFPAGATRVDGLLVSGMPSGVALRGDLEQADAVGWGQVCLSGNAGDWSAGVGDSFAGLGSPVDPPELVVTDDLLYRDLLLPEVRAAYGLPAPCGAGVDAGIAERLWIHALSRLEPETLESWTRIVPDCQDGVDNDRDGFTDFVADADGDGIPDLPGDPVCKEPYWPREGAACQDGLDNDGSIGTDYDGGVSILGAGGGDPDGPDPECGVPWRNREDSRVCGLGFELALLLPALAVLRRRARRIRAG